MYIAPNMMWNLSKAYHDESIIIPGHVPIGIELRIRNEQARVQVSMPSLVAGKHRLPEAEVNDILARQQEKQNALNWTDGVDELYRAWSSIWVWATFLKQSYGHLHKTRASKGRVTAGRTLYMTPMSPRHGLWLRRVANFVQKLKRVKVALRRKEDPPAGLWSKIISGAKPLAERYGVPDLLHAMDSQPMDIAEKVLDESQKFCQKVWAEEIQQIRRTARTDFRACLAEHSGINRVTSRMLRPHELNHPTLLIGGEVISRPVQVVKHVQNAWEEILGREPPPLGELWLRTQRPTGPVHACELPDITAEMVKQTLGRKAKKTAAGQDSWHMDELACLPLPALQGLADLYNAMEKQKKVPLAMAQAWMALVPKSAQAGPPSSVRPISVLATTYRVWASMRATQVQQWADATFHKWQVAFVKGRSPRIPLAQRLYAIFLGPYFL